MKVKLFLQRIIKKDKQEKLERRVYVEWAITGYDKQKSAINCEIFQELKEKYQILKTNKNQLTPVVQSDWEKYDVVIKRYPDYNSSIYKILKNAPNLKVDELALICDNGNLCFGYKYLGEENGFKLLRVFENLKGKTEK